VRGQAHLAERLAGRGLGQDRIGFGRVLVTEEPRLVLDYPHVDRVDPADSQRREGPRQPTADRAREIDLLGGRQRGQVQLIRQLAGSELRAAAARAGPGRAGRRAANSRIAAICVQAEWDSIRRAAEMIPIS